MRQTANMNPHMKLEFAKIIIRNKAIEISMRLRKMEITELKDLNDQIGQNNELLKRYTDENSLNIITRELKKCKQERDTILQRQGESLSMKAKTRWYNEKERSNKYFLNLLKRNNKSSEISKIIINGTVTTNKGEIRKGVTEFYTELYNNGNHINIDNDFLDEMFTKSSSEPSMMARLTLETDLVIDLKGSSCFCLMSSKYVISHSLFSFSIWCVHTNST